MLQLFRTSVRQDLRDEGGGKIDDGRTLNIWTVETISIVQQDDVVSLPSIIISGVCMKSMLGHAVSMPCPIYEEKTVKLDLNKIGPTISIGRDMMHALAVCVALP